MRLREVFRYVWVRVELLEVGGRMCGVVRDGAEVRWVEAAMLGAMMLGGVGRAD